MRPMLRVLAAASFVFVFASAGSATSYQCEGGYSVPTTYETTIRYYNSSQQPIGWEVYGCDDSHITHGNLNGVWLEETDIECCSQQTQHAYFYLCPSDNIWHQVTGVGDTNCS